MLAALAEYRTQGHAHDFQGTLGWRLADSRHGLPWRNNPHLRAFHDSALLQAETLGYKIKIFGINDMRMGWPRAADIARSRGVKGLLVCPQPEPYTRLDAFTWEHFSAVTFGHTLPSPRLDTVGAAQTGAMTRILSEMTGPSASPCPPCPRTGKLRDCRGELPANTISRTN